MDSKGNWVRVADASGPRYNTETSQNCDGRQYLAYNYPIGAANPAGPVVHEMDSEGSSIRALRTMRVTNPNLIASGMQAFRSNGWAGLDDTIVIWAFGSMGTVGSFPDTFCYSTNSYYGDVANGGIPAAVKDSFVVVSWYSNDTMQVPLSFDFMAQAILPTRGTGAPSFGTAGIIILIGLLIVMTVIIIRKRRRILPQ
jgi:hypothetical protein